MKKTQKREIYNSEMTKCWGLLIVMKGIRKFDITVLYMKFFLRTK